MGTLLDWLQVNIFYRRFYRSGFVDDVSLKLYDLGLLPYCKNYDISISSFYQGGDAIRMIRVDSILRYGGLDNDDTSNVMGVIQPFLDDNATCSNSFYHIEVNVVKPLLLLLKPLMLKVTLEDVIEALENY